jgi:hypothetical protein
MERRSLDGPRHWLNGVHEPLLSGDAQHNGEEGHREACCTHSAAPELTYEVVAECGSVPVEGDCGDD